MANQSDFQSNQGFKEIERWLNDYFASKAKDVLLEKALDKVKEKIAAKLGYNQFYDIVSGNFPAKKLADFASGILKAIWYEGYYIANGQFYWNQYDPAQPDQQDAYVEYLLYSWGRYLLDLQMNKNSTKRVLGGPGYIYNKIKW